ncbi:hypothetical protein [Okeania sp. KiyG1]|nr:hypothetical protein [Okeania sp. KiyG1]
MVVPLKVFKVTLRVNVIKFDCITRKKEEGRSKKEEGRSKKEEVRRKK